MSIDKYLNRVYDRKKYNCAHLVCEVWQDLTGVDIAHIMRGFLAGRGERKTILSELRKFKPLARPVSPCIVLMQLHKQTPHVGIFLRGKVLHIHENGVEFLPVDIAGRSFTRIRFYTC